ncbi:phosphoribosylglycinamide formyltransferase [candidate division WOR-3 bacterium RBG_13_43_14]|uniref:Phosphoribosylglycinamide formyltransferase n=1 Tax=candidate division WOR-3 bacterium RBG_13_43_14 TaxID=1802590 RepID=A0A1F4U5D4_UNCW3|nr:MAG: phosphoribosylglycinamide formyltransferase [candidate division WOR-3 bacterium RBG_13_43_14]
MKNIAVLASGRGSNLEAIIKNIKNGTLHANLACVISDREDANALAIARDAGYKALYLDPGPKKTWLLPEYEEKYVTTLQDHKIDLVCLSGFMRIIKQPLLTAFAGRILNIHPSLLPAFPGLEVQKKALEYGVKFSGCTVHFVDDTVDGGPIIAQAAVPILDDDDADTLAARILKEEHRIYTEAINLVLSGKYKIEGRRVIKTG